VLLLSGDGAVREAHTRWSGGAAMNLAPSLSVSSDLALSCRIREWTHKRAGDLCVRMDFRRR
jgi:hypothetical protein